MSRTQRRAVPLGAADKVTPGEAVYVKAGDCNTPWFIEPPRRGRGNPLPHSGEQQRLVADLSAYDGNFAYSLREGRPCFMRAVGEPIP
jgi:hypothetical protein